MAWIGLSRRLPKDISEQRASNQGNTSVISSYPRETHRIWRLHLIHHHRTCDLGIHRGSKVRSEISRILWDTECRRCNCISHKYIYWNWSLLRQEKKQIKNHKKYDNCLIDCYSKLNLIWWWVVCIDILDKSVCFHLILWLHLLRLLNHSDVLKQFRNRYKTKENNRDCVTIMIVAAAIIANRSSTFRTD